MRQQATRLADLERRLADLERRRDNRLALLLAPVIVLAFAMILTWPVWH